MIVNCFVNKKCWFLEGGWQYRFNWVTYEGADLLTEDDIIESVITTRNNEADLEESNDDELSISKLTEKEVCVAFATLKPLNYQAYIHT